MIVRFYNNRSDKRKLSKSLSSLGSTDCMLKEPSDILRPTFTIKRQNLTEYARCNYIYVPAFNRYYFAEIAAEIGDMLTIRGVESDVLMSWGNRIRSINCTIVRQENVFNTYMVDNLLPVRATKWLDWISVGTYDAGQGLYLTVDGGNANA